MKVNTTILIIIVITLLGCEQQLASRLGRDIGTDDDINIIGDYLGQIVPDTTPKLFAPGIVSNGLNNRDITMTPSGDEIYFVSSTSNFSYAGIFVVKRVNNIWDSPKIVSFGTNKDYISIEPCLSSDGRTLFYASNKPISDSSMTDDMNIWQVERANTDWGTPVPLDLIINTVQGEYFPSLTKDGTLYFTREEVNRINFIYRSELQDGKYSKPEKLPAQVNCGKNRFNAYISPDESFIIIPAIGVEEAVTGVNYYISFRNKQGIWSEPQNMGKRINNDLGRGWSASISPDGNYLFFMSSKGLDENSKPEELSSEFFDKLQTEPQNGSSDIYWVSTKFILDLESQASYED